MGNYDLNCYFYKEYIIAKMTCFADTSRLCCQNELPCFLLHDRGNKNTYLFWFMTGSDIDCEEGAMIYSENLAGVAKLKDKLYPIAKLQINGQEVFHTLDISYKNNYYQKNSPLLINKSNLASLLILNFSLLQFVFKNRKHLSPSLTQVPQPVCHPRHINTK